MAVDLRGDPLAADAMERGIFFHDIFIATDHKAYVKLTHLWDRMGLPVPEEGEYLYGENGVQIFLNPLGLLINIRTRNSWHRDVFESRSVRHDNVLQPLYRRDLSDKTTFEIVPGVRREGANDKIIADLTHRLKQSGLRFHERDGGYVGILPGIGKGKIVVANRSAVGFKAKKNIEPLHPQTQQKIFGPLSEEIHAAFWSASQYKIHRAFATCARLAALPAKDSAKILHASWTHMSKLGPRQNDIVGAATAYGHKLDFTG